MPDRENEKNIFGGQPTVLGDASVTAARQNELTPSHFSGPPQERMVGQQLKSSAHALNLLARLFGVLRRDEIKQPLEIGERSAGYFDRRHARAFGGRALAPAARAAR